MVTKTLSAIAVLAIAGSAFGAASQFNLRGTFEASDTNPDIVGGENITTNTDFYDNALNGLNGGPNPAFFAIDPDLEFDTYIAIDGAALGVAGPSGGTHQSQGWGGQGGSTQFVSSSSLSVEAVFATAGVGMDSVTVGDIERIFTGRLTTFGEGELLDGNGDAPSVARFGIFDSDAGTGVVNLTLSLNGAAVAGPGGNVYTWTSESFSTQLTDGTAVTVHDTYLVAIPTPGAAALFGVAGLVGLRRRRS